MSQAFEIDPLEELQLISVKEFWRSARLTSTGLVWEWPRPLAAAATDRRQVANHQQFIFSANQFVDVARANLEELNSLVVKLGNIFLPNQPDLQSKTVFRKDSETAVNWTKDFCVWQSKFKLDYQISNPLSWPAEFFVLLDFRYLKLYLLLPSVWHQWCLRMSSLPLQQVMGDVPLTKVVKKLAAAKIGIVGLSVGSNVVEGINREVRPAELRLIDHDYLTLANLSRIERGELNDIGVNKAVLAARRQHCLDPFQHISIFTEPLSTTNIDNFLGYHQSHSRLDLVIDESDNFATKLLIREYCRLARIPVMMITDLGYQAQLIFQNYQQDHNLTLGLNISDEELRLRVKTATEQPTWQNLALAAVGFGGDRVVSGILSKWLKSPKLQQLFPQKIPQSGATAMIAGGVAGIFAAKYFLGAVIAKVTEINLDVERR